MLPRIFRSLSPPLPIHFIALCIYLGGCGAGEAQPVVVAYVAVDRQHAEPILQKFTEQSGVKVQAVYDSETAKTTGLVTRLLAESDRPRCDVFWNNELAQTYLLADRELLAAYHSPAAADIPASLQSSTGLWTAVATRARVIVYNTQLVKPDEIPRSIFDLTNPRWKGRVAIANPQFGTTRTHVAALFAVLGPERAEKFLSELLANEVRIVDGNAMVRNLVARANPNASPILIGLTDTDDVLAGQADGDPIDMVYPDQDSLGTLIIPSSVCLIQQAPHPAQAKQLLDYLCSAGVENQLTQIHIGYRPVRPSTTTETAKPMQVDFAEVLKHLETSSQWTKEHFHP